MPISRRLKFRLRAIPLIATVAVVALGISLGNWQTRRAQEKMALEQRLAMRAAQTPLVLGAEFTVAELLPAEIEFRRVRARGHFIGDWPVYLDNRPYQGRAGLYVLMPFQIAQSMRVVWVARGWAARDPGDRSKAPAYATPAGEVTLDGVAVQSLGHVMQLGSAAPVTPGAIVQNVDLPGLERALGRKAAPFFIELQDSAALPADGLLRDWPKPSLGIDKHRGYAFQWYALAAMACIFFIVTGLRRGKQNGPQDGTDKQD